MSVTYKAELLPQGDFFFGGEYTFAKDDTRKEASRYSARSTRYPQQSAVAGMLRKTLLIQNGNMTLHIKGEWVDSKGGRQGNDPNYKEALRIAGGKPFSYEEENDFGIIEEISPVFLTHNGIAYTTEAFDADLEPTLLNGVTMNLGSQNKQALNFQGYDPKKHTTSRLKGSDGSHLDEDELFQKVESVGIKKAYTKEEQDDSYFQKTSYKLKGESSFSFFVTLAEELSWSEAFVTLGADQSAFLLRLTKTDESFDKLFSSLFEPKKLDRVVLHSETLMDKDAYDDALFVFGKRESHRQLVDKKGKKSKRYYLLERGSVIYTDDLEALGAKLGQPHLQKAGLNHFTPLKGC